jgi:hypothetical protein
MNDRDRYARDYGSGPRGPDPDLPIRGRGDWYAYDWPGTYDRADTGELEGGRYRALSNTYRAAGRRGPKNYQRSDERIREDICERLWHDSYIDSSEVEVKVQNGEVTLEGAVPRRDMKYSDRRHGRQLFRGERRSQPYSRLARRGATRSGRFGSLLDRTRREWLLERETGQGIAKASREQLDLPREPRGALDKPQRGFDRKAISRVPSDCPEMRLPRIVIGRAADAE